MYQIKITYPEYSAIYKPGGHMAPHFCANLREFAEKVWGFYADSCKYIGVGNRLYNADTVMKGNTEADGYLVPSGAIYYIDLDRPEREYRLEDDIHYEAIEMND